MTEYGYFILLGLTQLAHSQEEIWTDFHKRWFVFRMPRWVFVAFEVLFALPIIVYIVNPHLPFASIYMPSFALIMFVNGIGHIVWSLVKKAYIPGLVTAPIFVVVFSLYYISLVRSS